MSVIFFPTLKEPETIQEPEDLMSQELKDLLLIWDKNSPKHIQALENYVFNSFPFYEKHRIGHSFTNVADKEFTLSFDFEINDEIKKLAKYGYNIKSSYEMDIGQTMCGFGIASHSYISGPGRYTSTIEWNL